MSCVNGCVLVLDWCLPRTFFRSSVSGAGVLVYVLCLLCILGSAGGCVPAMVRLVFSSYFFHDARSQEPNKTDCNE